MYFNFSPDVNIAWSVAHIVALVLLSACFIWAGMWFWFSTLAHSSPSLYQVPNCAWHDSLGVLVPFGSASESWYVVDYGIELIAKTRFVLLPRNKLPIHNMTEEDQFVPLCLYASPKISAWNNATDDESVNAKPGVIWAQIPLVSEFVIGERIFWLLINGIRVAKHEFATEVSYLGWRSPTINSKEFNSAMEWVIERSALYFNKEPRTFGIDDGLSVQFSNIRLTLDGRQHEDIDDDIAKSGGSQYPICHSRPIPPVLTSLFACCFFVGLVYVSILSGRLYVYELCPWLGVLGGIGALCLGMCGFCLLLWGGVL
jgi:hypothetical protein